MRTDSPAAVREQPLAPVTQAFVPAQAAIQSGEHFRALDGIRGGAILLVMFFHFSAYGHGLIRSDVWIDRLYYRISGTGWIGVDLFFVLSGFLITGILYDAKHTDRYFRNFYARRVLRIFPLYYAALLLFLVILPWLRPDDAGLQAITRDGAWYWSYLANVRIADMGWPEVPLLGHFWSLAVEEQFYLVWPVIVLLLDRRRLQLACVLCIFGAIVVRVGLHFYGNPTAAFVFTPARVDVLAVGAYIAVAARGPSGLQQLSRIAPPVAASLAAVLLFILGLRRGFAAYDPWVFTLGLSVLALFFGAVLVLALTMPRHTKLARLLDSSVLSFFGRYSYGLYVIHSPILFMFAGAVPLTILPTVFGSQLLRQLAFLLIATAVSVAMALASWHVLEKQFLKLKRHFPYGPPAPDRRQSRRYEVIAADQH
jgi:peptidoglycan/LPS O-acetylase OafA/YrhL